MSQVEFIFESGIEIKFQGSSGTNKLVPTHPHKICARYDPSVYVYVYVYAYAYAYAYAYPYAYAYTYTYSCASAHAYA